MAGEKADMVFTDPPYNVKISGLGSGSSDNMNSIGKIHGEFVMASGEMSENEFTEFLSRVFRNLKENSKDGSIHYVCMDWRHMKEIMTAGNVYEDRTTVGGGSCQH
jgi:DNA modification methylase